MSCPEVNFICTHLLSKISADLEKTLSMAIADSAVRVSTQLSIGLTYSEPV